MQPKVVLARILSDVKVKHSVTVKDLWELLELVNISFHEWTYTKNWTGMFFMAWNHEWSHSFPNKTFQQSWTLLNTTSTLHNTISRFSLYLASYSLYKKYEFLFCLSIQIQSSYVLCAHTMEIVVLVDLLLQNVSAGKYFHTDSGTFNTWWTPQTRITGSMLTIGKVAHLK